MEKEFVPYKQALELKELGYNENYIAYYQNDGKLHQGKLWKDRDSIKAPLYQQAFRWFREKYALAHNIHPIIFDCFVTYQHNPTIFIIPNCNTYEEAELGCLKKLIELVKEKI